MKHLGTKVIETERLILRPFTMDDAQAIFDNYASDPEVTRYLLWSTHQNVDETRAILARWVENYEKEDIYNWAIVLKENGPAPIGSITGFCKNPRHGVVHMGYTLGRAWWRRGIMTETLGAVITFFFDEVGADRVEAVHDTRNPSSGAVMRKCGMTFEGTRRQADRTNSGVCDLNCYAILKSDKQGKVET